VSLNPLSHLFKQRKLEKGFTAEKANVDVFGSRRVSESEVDDSIRHVQRHPVFGLAYIAIVAGKITALRQE
jgi:hypothetical protein